MNAKRIVVIGFDSLDVGLTRRWADAGEMPNFRRLFQESRWGMVDNPIGLEAGCVWPTFTTGHNPGRHGLFNGNYRFDPRHYRLRTIRLDERASDPVWVMLGDAGKRVAVVDSPYELLEKRINGVQVTDWLPHVFNRYPGPTTRPRGLAREIVENYGSNPFDTPNRCATNDAPVRTAADVAALRDRLLDRLQRKGAFCVDLMRREPWDFYQAVFEESHDIGHMCWHIHDTSHEDHDAGIAAEIGDPLLDIYRATDAVVGQLLDAVEPDQRVIIFTSHGMGPERTATGLLDDILARLEAHYDAGEPVPAPRADDAAAFEAAVPAAGGPGGPLAWLAASYRTLVPESLRRRALDTALMTRVYAHLDTARMRRRRFFEVTPNHATGGIRLNLAGRESHGRVAPGAEARALCERIAADLGEMRNAETGEKLIDEAMLTDEIYHGPRVSYLPDLLVEWNKSGPINRVHSPSLGTIERRRRSVRSGDHVHKRGAYFALGPGLGSGEGAAVKAADFAPTIAAALGVEGADYDGAVIRDICA